MVQAVHRGAIAARHKVSVHVDGDLNRRVPELVADVREAFAVLDQQRGVRVRRIVNPHLA
jgi:hypothetical protein